MRKEKLIANLLAAGLDSSLCEKIVDNDYNLTKLRAATKKELSQTFDKDEVATIRERLQRAPIADDVISELIQKCDWSCCLCWDIDRDWPIILHHMIEHAQGGDDSYGNLVILCLNHHGIAHSSWEISRHPAPVGYIRNRKSEFEKAISEFKAGKRSAPGREGNGTDPKTQSDIQSLEKIAGFLDRPAMFRPFGVEGNMHDFLKEMTNFIRALNIGKLRTRENEDLGEIKPFRFFSNPRWSEKLGMVRDLFDTLRTRLEVAIRDGDLQVSPEGNHYCFNNMDLPFEIDSMRRTAASIMNPVLIEANLPTIRGPQEIPPQGS